MDPETDPQGLSSTMYSIVRAYACEAQTFVLSSSGILGEKDFPDKWKHLKGSDHKSASGGTSPHIGGARNKHGEAGGCC